MSPLSVFQHEFEGEKSAKFLQMQKQTVGFTTCVTSVISTQVLEKFFYRAVIGGNGL